MKSPLPQSWQIPQVLRDRLGDSVGRQRAMAAEGHLLLVLHEPPGQEHHQRHGRFFWRDSQGHWKSNSLGTGPQSLAQHLGDFSARLDALEDQLEQARRADDFYRVLRAVAPLHRTLRNLHAALQQARELMPADRDLLNFRDQSGNLERAAELLHHDARTGLDFTIARSSEEQTHRTYEMAVAAHRLNVLAAVFLPLVAVGSVFGMNLVHGLESFSAAPFWLLVAAGMLAGVLLTAAIVTRPTPPAPTATARTRRDRRYDRKPPAARPEAAPAASSTEP